MKKYEFTLQQLTDLIDQSLCEEEGISAKHTDINREITKEWLNEKLKED